MWCKGWERGQLKFALDFIRVLDDKLTSCRNRYVVTKSDAVVREAMNWIWLAQELWGIDVEEKTFYHPEKLLESGFLDPADQRRVRKINRLKKYFSDLVCEGSYDVLDEE